MKGWKYEGYRHSLAARGVKTSFSSKNSYRFIGSKDEDPSNFIQDNIKPTGDHSVDKFWSGSKYTIFHPFKDADGEWVEYNMLAGNKDIKLAKDKAERMEQRFAAIFARVASQANVEALVDKEQNKSFRQAAVEIEFGRRDGDEKDDEALIKSHEESNQNFSAKDDKLKRISEIEKKMADPMTPQREFDLIIPEYEQLRREVEE